MATSVLEDDISPTSADEMHLEIFCLVWLDAGASTKDVRDSEQKLRSIINRFKKFQDVKQCQQYIMERSQQERVVMIVSGQLGRQIVPSIHELRQVIAIYVYCMNKNSNKEWADNFAKVKAVIVEIDELISRIKADHKIQKVVEEPLSISVFNTNTEAGTSTTGVNGQFVFYQVLIDCLLRLTSTEQDKEELINLCKEQYKGNSTELNNLCDFQDNYSPDQALWWYTKESFFYKTLNAALRKQDFHFIYLFRAFICDIHRQLTKYQLKQPQKVYRSQMISSDELKMLEQCCDQFISVNSFFSTSTDKEKALSFVKTSETTDNLKPVLFEIDANPSVVTIKPFADLSPYSAYPGESEILFMLGAIFHLDSIYRSSDSQLSIIRMTLCGDEVHALKEVLVHLKKQLGNGETNLHILGRLLWDMSRPDLAEKYFLRLLEQLPSNDPSIGKLYDDLGKLASQAGKLDKSMEWHKKAREFENQSKPIIPMSKPIQRNLII
ncbi:unnamed protein product [Rotaria sp. Silwood2]|nr:unnamed protein product [Rotaria sp. Silwood2]CAF3065442.1 unnamed protein product [Rotaria sp. Silwood2]CAF3292301.1 unnamed protein product [Rotaria sp. Silwood2]CAF3341547.1 unnamed protein product [Rotaria sp. Silwood2]CAF4201373.1 unnamed protein product [Rotaria sp. Silwood2]